MSKTTKSDDVVTANDSNVDLIDENSNSENYKIINFFKKEPSMIITIITSIITVVTIILSFVANLIQKQYLSYWNISTELIKYNTTNLLQQLGISIVICFSSITCITLINIFFAKYFSEQMHTMQVLCAYKECRRHLKKIVRKKWLSQVCLFVLKKTKFLAGFNFWSKSLDKNRELIEKNDKSLEVLGIKIEKAKKVCTSKNQYALPKLVVKLIILTLIMFFVFLLFNMFVVSDGFYIEITVCITFGVIALYSLLGYFAARKKVPRKEIKTMVQGYLNGDREWKIFEYKNEYNKKHFKEFFTDDVLKRSVVMLSLFLVCIILGLSISVSENPKEQKDFYIVEHQNESYVVLHTFDNNLVLEKATEIIKPENDQKQIVIDTSTQTIISIDGVTVRHCEYDVVKQTNQEQQ